jgi:2-aminobenzoate-CoA ligase
MGIGSTEMLHIFISSPEVEIRPEEVPTGNLGRLAVRGPTGCRYLNDSDQQKQYVQRGWNLMSDIYRKDADGYFWYLARMDDMIVLSGYKIAWLEVESVLLEHPKVLDCAVIGVTEPHRAQIVKAFVVPRRDVLPDDTLTVELQNFVKSQIAPHKYPRSVEFRDRLPRTVTGKLQRYLLRARSGS